MRKRLKAPCGLCELLIKCYGASSHIPRFEGVLISSKGVLNGGLDLRICNPCFMSLMNKVLRSPPPPPRFAIANGLYIGWLPDKYADTSPTEHAMVSLTQSTKLLTVVRGGLHTAIRSHVYYFRADSSTPASLLPREVVADGTIGVTMVGSMTPLQKTATYRRYDGRVPRLKAWYGSNNDLFGMVHVRREFFREGGLCANPMRRSSSIISDFDKPFWVHAFVELFPFGRGGLDERRKIDIGVEEYIRYCLRLSSRRRATHHAFTLVAFDVLARHHAMQAIYLRARLSPSSVATSAAVRREELLEHLKQREDRLRNIASNRTVGAAPRSGESIRNLYSFITTGMRAHYGSNEERSRARSDLLSMQLAYGQPSIFFYRFSSSSSAYRVAAFAGSMEASRLDPMRQVADESLYLSKAKLGAVAASNPMACARYYDAVISIFVD
ncbi:hypothetical protein GQ600_2610 [Phytophthora cactorum]|nr:hypothetical protein GQ600_2610 [Phytophthora cactorum]